MQICAYLDPDLGKLIQLTQGLYSTLSTDLFLPLGKWLYVTETLGISKSCRGKNTIKCDRLFKIQNSLCTLLLLFGTRFITNLDGNEHGGMEVL